MCPAKVGHCAALTYEVIDDQVRSAIDDISRKQGLPRQAAEPVGARVIDHVGLHDAGIAAEPELLGIGTASASGISLMPSFSCA